MWLSVDHKSNVCSHSLPPGAKQTGEAGGALQFRCGRRRSVACLLVSARDAGSAQIPAESGAVDSRGLSGVSGAPNVEIGLA